MAAPMLVGLIILAQVGELHRYLNRTQQILGQFFAQIRFDDFTGVLAPSDQHPLSLDLKAHMETVLDQFRFIRLEKEETYRYLEQVIQQMAVPTLAISGDEVTFLNAAARHLLGIGHIRQFSELPQQIQALFSRLKPGRKESFRWQQGGESFQLLAQRSVFKLQTRTHALFSLQDIRAEIDQTELKAWHKLTRVLHHEIMNSVTPLLTLTEAIENQLFDTEETYQGATLPAPQQKDLLAALRLLQGRSEALQHFIADYKSATQLPLPKPKSIAVSVFLENICRLFQQNALQQGVKLHPHCLPADMDLQADEELTEQILINLIINALHSLEGKEQGEIRLTGRQNLLGEVEIQVFDNGQGIPAEQIDEIFIPFFTTKQTGSGLGLAISRQIMQAHGGSLTVESSETLGTVFTLRFPA